MEGLVNSPLTFRLNMYYAEFRIVVFKQLVSDAEVMRIVSSTYIRHTCQYLNIPKKWITF